MKTSRYEINAGLGFRLSFAFLSDLHEKNTDEAFRLTAGSSPDAVLVGGDYIQDGDRFEKGIALLSSLAELFPVFCSLGNHEFKYEGDIRSLTKATGVTLLDNTDVLFRGVRIGGLTSGFDGRKQGTFKKTPPPDTAFLDGFSAKDGFKLLLCHHPEYYADYVKGRNIDLTLSGHAHGGQWRLFGRGLYAPGQGLFPKYTSGMYDGRLIVSRGIGDSHRIPRINNDFEYVLLTLT